MTSNFFIHARVVVFLLWMETKEVSNTIEMSVSVVSIFLIKTDELKKKR